jgi:hypothetical protein
MWVETSIRFDASNSSKSMADAG